MSVLILNLGNIGPFKSIEVLDDRLRCDGTDYPFTVIGEYQISEDDSLAQVPPTPKRSREAIQADLDALDLKSIRAIREGDAARVSEWELQAEMLREELRNV